MRRMKGALRAALAVFAAMAPVLALAQSNGVPPPYPPPRAGEGAGGVSAMAGTLAPREILAEARQAGFEPISRPVQRGRVYVLFAVDPYDMDVKLTLDAGSGRVLRVTGIIGPRYSWAGYYSYRPLSRYERPPIPPGDVPNIGFTRNNFGPARSNAFMRPSLPLPRTRPADLTHAVAKETASPPPYTSPRAGADRAAPVRSDVAPAAKSPAVTMVPVAPLE
jgi:hypothetical protein